RPDRLFLLSKEIHAMKTLSTLIVLASLALWIGACEQSTEDAATAGGHTHADGSTHADHAEEGGDMAAGQGQGGGAGEEDHAHDETPLESAQIGDMTVELAQ